MDLVTALRTTGAIRQFTGETVDDATIYRILDQARFAPSGGNRQGWRVIVVKDPATRTALRDLYLEGWYQYLALTSAGLVPFAPITDEAKAADALTQSAAVRAKAKPGFAEHLDEVPVLLLVVADLRVIAAVDKDLDRYTFAGGASVYPFTWNLLLAAREEGLGGVITTMPLRVEPGVKDLFGIGPEFALAALVALGHPEHQPTRLTRNRVETFTTVDRLDGEVLVP